MTGILVLDKPEGMTSFSAVKKVRWCVREKKAGHAGTLDPMATGVLPVMLGGATRFLEFFPDEGKEYIASFRLGIRTDTLDITGTVLEERPVTCGRSDVEAVLGTFRGEIFQVPPMYSALKKVGVRLYDLARQGIEVEREARPVTIRSLELLPDEGTNTNEYRIAVSCSKGTYIRTLVDDIGNALGCGAVMTALRRTATCGFTLDNAVSVEELEQAREEGGAENFLIPLDRALERFPEVTVSEKQAIRFHNGGSLSLSRIERFRREPAPAQLAIYRIYGPSRDFLGLGETDSVTGDMLVRRIYSGR